MKSPLKALYQDTISFDSLPADAVLDAGDLAIMKKSARNTKPVPHPSSFGEVIHMDIVFGPEVSLGNVHHALLLTDRFSGMNYLYPLQNLTTNIQKQRMFLLTFGFCSNSTANCQDYNGLAKCHWQTMTSLARNWLASAEFNFGTLQ
jgi:hypothetical protein